MLIHDKKFRILRYFLVYSSQCRSIIQKSVIGTISDEAGRHEGNVPRRISVVEARICTAR